MKLEKLAHFQSELTFLVKWSPGSFSTTGIVIGLPRPAWNDLGEYLYLYYENL